MNRSRPSARQRVSPSTFRPRLESLEDRSVPATFNVTTTLDVIDPADGKRSLREAITAANNLAGADVIVLPAGVYKLALAGAGDDANATGDFDVSGTVTIRGVGASLNHHRRPAARPGLRCGGHRPELDQGRAGENDHPQRERDRPRRGHLGRQRRPCRARRDRRPETGRPRSAAAFPTGPCPGRAM